MNFSFLGDGQIAKYHHQAIKEIGGTVIGIFDPKYTSNIVFTKFWDADYIVICSPSNLHLEYTKLALSHGCKVIVEKPACLPWQYLIDNDDINVVLQLRYLNLPEKASKVNVRMVRNEDYFRTWKGNVRNTGGLLYNLFIHYIDLADILGADFEGIVTTEGKQERRIDDFDIMSVDTQSLYNKMYQDIIIGGGIKPKDIQYLHWILNRGSEIFGFGRNGLNKLITIPNELL